MFIICMSCVFSFHLEYSYLHVLAYRNPGIPLFDPSRSISIACNILSTEFVLY
jgi:hypothetical protein